MQSVYALIDPRTNEVRYIGIAQDVYKRYAQHLVSPHPNEAKNVWMEEMKGAGIVPVLSVLESDVDDVSIYERERHWVQHYLALNAPLTNIMLTQQSKVEEPEIEVPEPIHVIIGRRRVRLRVKEVAAQKGVSMTRLHQCSRVAYSSVRTIFRDPYADIALTTLARLGEALDVPTSDLIEDTLVDKE